MNQTLGKSTPGCQWVDVAAFSALDADFPVSAQAGAHKLGLYLHGGEARALEDVCPHAYALLSQGFVEDGVVECPLHAARFDIASGKCLNEIGQRDLRSFPVRVVAGRVEVDIGDASPGDQP
jgi:nitrite reductase/ring-hydroxylating ferredoxin subunit